MEGFPYRLTHLVREASNKGIQIYCDGDWDSPKWNPVATGDVPKGVYLSEKLRHYTFDLEFVNCEECLEKLG